MSGQQFHKDVSQPDVVVEQDGNEQRWERKTQNIFERLFGRIAQLGYGRDHTSKHRAYTHTPRDKKREKRNIRNAMAKESRRKNRR